MTRQSKANSSDASSKRKLRYQKVHDWVLDYISEKGLAEGDRLPSSTELARLTGDLERVIDRFK